MNNQSLTPESTPPNRHALKIAGLYLLIGGLWILFSDELMLILTRDPIVLHRLSIFKGWGFIVTTALLLYWLIRRYSAGLSQSEARYRSLFQNNHSVMLLIDTHTGKIVDANPSACAFYGYTHTEITGLKITDISQLSHGEVFAEMERARQEQRGHFFFRHRLAGGDIREVEVYSGPIEGQGKALLYSIVHDITARKLLEESLRRSERTLQLFVEYAPAAIAMFDRNMVYLAASKRFLADYRLKDQAVVGRSHYDIFPEIPERWKAIHRRCLAGTTEMCAEDPFPREDGTLDWVRWEIHPWYKDDAEIGGIILFSELISERKQAQEALRENEERLRLALMAANQGLYDLNIQTGEAQVGPEYATMLGYDPATFHETNAAWTERLHPDDRQLVADNYRAYIAGEVPVYAVEFRQRTQTGDWKWILSLGKIVAWDGEGRPLRMLGTHTDIHARKLAEQQLLYQANLLQNVSDAIIATDLDFKITSWNRAAEAIYGWSAAEVLGRSTTELFQVEYNSFQPGQIDQHFQVQGFWQGEVTQKSKSGAAIQIMASVSLIRDSQGQPMGVVAVNRDITAYRQTEAQLQQATIELIFLNDLLKHSTQPISVANMQGQFIRFNRAFEQLTGYQAAELLQLTYEQLTPEPWHDIEAHHIASLLATGQAVRFEKEYRNKDGTVTPIEIMIELYRDAQGEPLYTYAFTTDISERKQAEEKLRDSEAQLNTIFEVSPVAIGISRLRDGRITHINPAFETLYGYSRAEILGKTTPELNTWENPADRRHFMELLKAEGFCTIEAIALLKSGDKRYVLVSGRVVTINGEPCTMAQIVDITERKQAEKELQEVWDFFKKIFERNPVAITLSKLSDRIIVDANEATEKLFGYTRAELIGKSSTNFDYWINAEARQRGYEILLKEGQLRDYEFAFRTKAGALGQAILYIEVIEQFGEKYFLSIFVDITARKQAEADLHRIMAELKRSNADLEQFAYAASHDLQEPLRAVAGTVQLLQKRYGGQLDERADEFIHHAVEGASRMQTLINDLLVLSRVGTRGQPFRPVASADALADALANLSVAIRESEATISYDNLPTILADRPQMTQLFQNLIGNAIKFRGDKAPEIQVKAERQHGEWVFAVADNGIGLEAKDFERIFGVFQRLHTRREYPGTGIGLALCKKIVERHGGRIWVESQPGQGSTFYFTLS